MCVIGKACSVKAGEAGMPCGDSPVCRGQLPGVQGATPRCAGGDSPVCRGDPNEVACRPESARPVHCSARYLVLSVE